MVFLINPYITSTERYGKDIGEIGGSQMPLGIYYLAAQLIKDNVDVEVLDCEVKKITHEEVIHLIEKSGCRIVGITSTTVAFYRARALAEKIKGALKDVTIVIGGPHMTSLPKETMDTGVFDFGVVHEGELVFSKLVQSLQNSAGNLLEIPNLYYMENGTPRFTYQGEFIKDMDSIPFPARSLCQDISIYKPPVGQYKSKPVVSMITSRGCPYKCIFCDNNTFGTYTRYASAEYVVEEIKAIIKEHGTMEIAFLDDTFIIKKKRLYRIFEMLKQDGIFFPWTCMTRVDNLTEDLVEFMADNGCWQMRFGIESGSQEVLSFIKKGITLEQVRHVAGWCHKYKIQATGFFMIGHHIDTVETINQTIAFAKKLPLTDVTATINTPMPGTESYRIAREYGTYDEKDWSQLNYWSPIFVPKGLTAEMMLKKQGELYRKFYLRPSVIYKQLKKIRSWEILLIFIHNAWLGLKYTKPRG